MPSERANIPGETYHSLLNHNRANHLPIQAGEVAWMRGKDNYLLRTLTTILLGAAAVSVLVVSVACAMKLTER